MAFRRIFYCHVAVLHLSLILRIGGDLTGSFSAYRCGGLLGVVALAMFLAASLYGMAAGQSQARAPSA
jgi:hypothetical protein